MHDIYDNNYSKIISIYRGIHYYMNTKIHYLRNVTGSLKVETKEAQRRLQWLYIKISLAMKCIIMYSLLQIVLGDC